MKTTFTRTTAADIRTAIEIHWREAIEGKEVQVRMPNGANGGVVYVNSELQWFANDAVGNKIEPVERSRSCGSQTVSYNYIRGQRPAAAVRFGPPAPPERDGFFPRQPENPLSIRRRRCLVVGISGGREVGLVPNAFPFAAQGHFLAFLAQVIDDEVQFPWIEQHLNFETLSLILDLAADLGPHYAVGYNDPKVGGTQLMFHPQVVKAAVHPVERAVRIPLADGAAFPLYSAGCLIAQNASAAMLLSWVRRLQMQEVPLNMLVRERTVYLFPRRKGVGVVPEFPSGMIAFSELAGNWICSSDRVYEALEEHHLRNAHEKVTLPVDEAWAIVAG
jgi:hypothetical protein